LERSTERVAGGGEHIAAALLDPGAYNIVVDTQRRRHRLSICSPQPRASLNIGEQKRHDTRRNNNIAAIRHGTERSAPSGHAQDPRPTNKTSA
jgi:hypothetical protein